MITASGSSMNPHPTTAENQAVGREWIDMKMVLRNTETSGTGKWRKDEKPLADKAAHLIRHPQASPSAWQSSPLRSGCRTGSQLQLICACKVQTKAPSIPEGSLIEEPLLGLPTSPARLR